MMTAATKSDLTPQRRKRAVAFVLMTILIDAIGFGIIIPVLPRLVMEVGEVNLARATEIGGWLALAYAFTQFILGPTIGNLGDRYGRRWVLLFSLAGYSVDYMLMGFAPTLAWLFVGRFLAGIFGGTYGPCQAALADITLPEERAKTFGYVGAAFGLGFILGPAIGGALGEIGHRVPFFAAGALAAINLVFGYFNFPETLDDAHRRPFDWKRANPLGAIIQFAKTPGLLMIGTTYLLWQLSSMVYPAIWSYYGALRYDWGPGMVGVSLAMVGVMMVACQAFVTGPTVKKFGERRAAQIGIIAAMTGYIGYAFITQSFWAFAIMPVFMISGLVQPALSAMLSQRVAANAQGEAQGFSASAMALGSIFAPLLYNNSLAHFSAPNANPYFPGAPFIIAALLALATLIALGLTLSRPNKALLEQNENKV